MLQPSIQSSVPEAGCDEAGRGCLCGPVVAAAVILPVNFDGSDLNDSKKISSKKRDSLRTHIERDSLAWAVAFVSPEEIDKINILQASILAMHKAVSLLKIRPEYLAIDGNKFLAFEDIPFQTVVKGDGKYQNIAAASILAKTHRDQYMAQLHLNHPEYNWKQNKGYPTREHIAAIGRLGYTAYHRKSFILKSKQIQLWSKTS